MAWTVGRAHDGQGVIVHAEELKISAER